ncbi:S-adenosyl-L-methionine-dependent methyltransferase [Pseudomassariella vexata]|uniref:S-adenosyl-L-methionine-dependent methyltransferase n=1 Tax=Pseudomassariella vexata TaxID=1141098 RepID=A0A1Y2DIW7_9PEZI|nr:S-adenosyl-L-methionine-dependent methyltransferase [Pseudomassariella vexata]ORY59177.1 S-adenosyl-L-methionine-dependent methyltransferase [Pseudomassariella vexata]
MDSMSNTKGGNAGSSTNDNTGHDSLSSPGRTIDSSTGHLSHSSIESSDSSGASIGDKTSKARTYDEDSVVRGGFYADPSTNESLDTGLKTATAWSSNFWLKPEPVVPDTPERIPTGYTISEPGSIVEGSGRTYNGYREGKYLLPNDGAEQDRLDFQHEIFRIAFDGALTLAPIGEPSRVLDIATGTGIWAFEFAESYPNSQVVGTDLSLIQPPRNIPNCTFVREDSEELWVHGFKFDYIHMRQVCTCFDNDMAVIQQAFNHLNEGGWMEIQDGYLELNSIDGTTEGTSLQRFIDLVHSGFRAMGRDLLKAKYYKKWLIQAGFVDICEKRLPVPINPWPQEPRFKNLGRYQNANFHQAVEAISLKTLPKAGLSQVEARDLMAQADRDHNNQAIHGYCSIYVVYGRKPCAWEISSQKLPSALNQ